MLVSSTEFELNFKTFKDKTSQVSFFIEMFSIVLQDGPLCLFLRPNCPEETIPASFLAETLQLRSYSWQQTNCWGKTFKTFLKRFLNNQS